MRGKITAKQIQGERLLVRVHREVGEIEGSEGSKLATLVRFSPARIHRMQILTPFLEFCKRFSFKSPWKLTL